MYGATVIIYLLIVRTLSVWSDVSIYLWWIYWYYCTLLVWSPGVWHTGTTSSSLSSPPSPCPFFFLLCGVPTQAPGRGL